jgi:hypothetical protein
VGILVDNKLHRKISSGAPDYENVDLYVKAGKKYGVIPCFFRIRDLRIGQSTVKAYVKRNHGYVRMNVPAPSVIHNRAFISRKSQNRRLSSFLHNGRLLFNRRTRYGKLHIHRLLWKDADLRPHMPATVRATAATIQRMMNQFDSLIVKPNSSSVGLGIMRIDRTSAGWKLTYPIATVSVKQKWRSIEWKGKNLPPILRKRIRSTFYIVQQLLPLATFKGSPFDLRVSVQRTANGHWGMTGIVAKVAPKHTFVTNVAQGGRTYQLHTILKNEYAHLNMEEIEKRIYNLSMRIAFQLSKRLPHMADLGLDVAVTTDGYPMFIECNGRDQRYTFRDAGMLDVWRATYDNPIGYAKYLLDKRSDK